jgi:hypothetical protein
LTKGKGVEIIDGQLDKYGLDSNPNDLEGNFVELDGLNSSGIAQSIETTPGQSYDLAFDFGSRDAHGGDNKMEVWWEGELVDTIEKQADGGSDWSTYNYQVTAGDPAELGDLSGKIEFRSVGDNDRGGELLDNVSLVVSDKEDSKDSNNKQDDVLKGGTGEDDERRVGSTDDTSSVAPVTSNDPGIKDTVESPVSENEPTNTAQPVSDPAVESTPLENAPVETVAETETSTPEESATAAH